jgi:glycosyltransferase involved in cell wall biosynthesis
MNYFGWQDKKFINEYLKKSHFTLMPSKFLETFGLTALESLIK